MINLLNLVSECYRKFGFESPASPSHLSTNEKAFRVECLAEELQEYEDAETLEDELDALVDLVVFALGTAFLHGFGKFNEAFRRVMLQNSLKEVGSNSKRGNYDQDLVKPDGWMPARLTDLVAHHANMLDFVHELPHSNYGQDLDFADLMTKVRNCIAEAYGVYPPSKSEKKVENRHATADSLHDSLIDVLEIAERRGTDDDQVRGLRDEFLTKIDDIGKLRGWIHPALLEANALQLRKSEDYGAPDWARAEYHPFGNTSYLHMLHLKLKRADSLAMNPARTPNFEPLRDSILDLINYASFFLSYVDQESDRGLESS